MPVIELGAETQAIADYMAASGVPYRITSTTGGTHIPTSRHYQGLAVDFGGPTPTRDSPALMAIFNALAAVEGQLYELIYARAPYNIKRGRRVALYCQAIHHDHVHVSVDRGVRITWPGRPATQPIQGGADIVTPEFDPPLARFVAWLNCPAGGGWGLSADGAIYALGGAPYLGAANGKDYFVGRSAARLEPHGDGYRVISSSGESYGPGF